MFFHCFVHCFFHCCSLVVHFFFMFSLSLQLRAATKPSQQGKGSINQVNQGCHKRFYRQSQILSLAYKFFCLLKLLHPACLALLVYVLYLFFFINVFFMFSLFMFCVMLLCFSEWLLISFCSFGYGSSLLFRFIFMCVIHVFISSVFSVLLCSYFSIMKLLCFFDS